MVDVPTKSAFKVHAYLQAEFNSQRAFRGRDPGSSLNQQLDDVMSLELHCVVQRVAAVAVALVHESAILKQVSDDLHVTFARGHVQRRAAIVVGV